MTFALIPAGKFQMGSEGPNADEDENPVHPVRISQAFYLGTTEVTQEHWKAIMGKDNNPSDFKGDDLPVETVSWNDTQKFVRQLNAKEGGGKYRLPTEAEWAYAARAGTTTAYSFGDDASELGKYAWYDGNSGGKTHPVGQLKANGWGLHDMHGNVWEWCQDGDGEFGNTEPPPNPIGPLTGSLRVNRGGSWYFSASFCRSAFRNWYSPAYRDYALGFRVALVPSSQDRQGGARSGGP
jgi:formylglycine-generating enzyme required for sulfatase activity